MRIIRYEDESGNRFWGVGQGNGKYVRAAGDPFDGGTFVATNDTADIRRFLAPVPSLPPAIIGVGLNYRRHAIESGMAIPEYPVIFYKNPGSVQHPDAPIVLPTGEYAASDAVDYECELAVVIGKVCRDATRENALDFVAGYTCANDVSARDWQLKRGGGQWSRAKGFDTFCPLGPCLVTPETIPEPNALTIRTRLNGETMQDETTGDMIFDVPTLIVFLSASATLVPGTVILTGTPQGVGMARTPPRYLLPGDSVTVEIERIGALTNPVVGTVGRP